MVQTSGSEKARGALAYLRGRIRDGDWPVNTRIPKEPELMELMGVGKSTVREAVRSLASMGMLETIRGVGTFVRSQTPAGSFLAAYLAEHSTLDILQYRRSLEIEAAQLAAVNRTDAHLAAMRAALEHDMNQDPDLPIAVERGDTPGPFHHHVFAASGNTLIASLYTGVMAALRKARTAGTVVHGANHTIRQEDHAELLAAIEARDVMRAAHAMAFHVERDLVMHDDDPDTPSLRSAMLAARRPTDAP